MTETQFWAVVRFSPGGAEVCRDEHGNVRFDRTAAEEVARDLAADKPGNRYVVVTGVSHFQVPVWRGEFYDGVSR